MPATLNEQAFNFAKELIHKGQFVDDDRDDWSEHRPNSDAIHEFITRYGIEEYAKWHLGEDLEHNPDTKGRYKFPDGDFEKIHRCGVLAAEVRAGQYKYPDIEKAAHELHRMIRAASRSN